MRSQNIKRLAVVILGMVAVMLSWAVFCPTNFSLPDHYIVPFYVPDTFFMFLLCNFIILALISIRHLGFSTNSNGVITDSFYEEFGETAYFQQQILSCDETAEKETPDSEDSQPAEKMKFIYSAEDAGYNATYSSNKSEKVGCVNIVKYTENCEEENCSVSLSELMQLVEVPGVIDTQRYNELASMIDEDFNRRVEEFIAKFNRQLRLQGQQHMSRRGLRL
jgi:hypothetical protein